MSNSKISALASASTPLAGTEVLPIVQSGATKQVSVANLTAGRSVSVGDLASTGNVVGARLLTISGSTALTNSGVAVTMFAAASEGSYIVNAYIFGTGAPANYTAVAIVKTSGGVAAVSALSAATNMTITVSGLNVQATQLSGVAQVISYAVTRLF
jgi:hypothetical protein